MSKAESKDLSVFEKCRSRFNNYAQTRSQAAFLIGSMISLMMYGPMIRQALIVADKWQLNDINYLWPKFSDLYISVVGYLIFSQLRKAFTLKMKPLLEKYISPKYSGVDRSDRAQKAATYAFKFGYYIMAICFGYYALHDQWYTPWTLLGSGDSLYTFKYFPYSPIDFRVRYYYLFTLTYHIDSMVALAMSKPKKDYGEMLFHHVVTVKLVVVSYLSNFTEGGALELYVHDFAQVFVALCRVFIDMKLHKAFTIVPFFFLILTWGLTRCVIFPYYVAYRGIYVSAIKYNIPSPIGYLQGFEFFIILMHYYWFALFLKIAYTLLVKKKVVDLVAEGSNSQK